MSGKYYRFGIAIFFLLIACSKHTVTDQVTSIMSDGWEYNDKMAFQYAVSDTSVSYDVFILVRNTMNYSYSNLWLFIETHSPGGYSQRDTLEILLADESGRWLGKGGQSINTLLAPYKMNIHFPERGIYQTTIQHAMRDTVLKHVTDIGLRIQYHIPK